MRNKHSLKAKEFELLDSATIDQPADFDSSKLALNEENAKYEDKIFKVCAETEMDIVEDRENGNEKVQLKPVIQPGMNLLDIFAFQSNRTDVCTLCSQ